MARQKRRAKLDELSTETVTVGGNGTATLDAQVPILGSRGFDLVLGIRRIRSGPFSGLWELSELTVEDDQQVKTIRIMTDANIKPIVIAQIGKRLNQCF